MIAVEAERPTNVLKDRAMNLQETQPGASGPLPDEGRRFTYSSGDRPLDGYTIKRGIGRGGFGEVYYAESDGGKEVALKLVRRNLEIELRGVGHCLNLKHQNLLSLFDVRTDSLGDRWIVMEYVGGLSLEDVVAQHPQGMPPAEALRWFHGMAGGVASLHDHGIVHRDLKPGNTFSDDGVVKIGDYGLSKFISCSRRSGQTESIGTVHYMAPEVANGRYGKEIDIYALGVMLYEMLTGDVPFGGESVGEVLMKHLTAEPDLQKLAEPYRTVIARALAKDPANRFASVREFAGALPGGAAPAGEDILKEVTPAARPRGAAPAAAVSHAATTPSAGIAEEPIYRSAREGWRQLSGAWSRAALPGFVKVIVLIAAGVFFLMAGGGYFFAWAVPLFILYGAYYVIRAIVLAWSDEPPVATPDPPNVPASPAAPAPALRPPAAVAYGSAEASRRATAAAARRLSRSQRRKRRWQKPAKFEPPRKSVRQKSAELVGGMIIAAVTSIGVALAIGLFGGGEVVVERTAWLASVGTLAAWAVLIPSKIWEGRAGAGGKLVQRLSLLGTGACVGAAAFLLSNVLMVRLPYEMDMPTREAIWSQTFYGAYGEPMLQAYLVYFGALFAGPRWWRRADQLRPAKLQLWSVFVLGGWAWFVSLFWRFPQPWGIVIAVAAAVGVQLGSSWIPLEDRKPKVEALDPVV